MLYNSNFVTRTTETAEIPNKVSVPMQHATYETLHQMGVMFEEFQKDKTKTIVVACTHSKDEANKVDITSKSEGAH